MSQNDWGMIKWIIHTLHYFHELIENERGKEKEKEEQMKNWRIAILYKLLYEYQGNHFFSRSRTLFIYFYRSLNASCD
jgi:hypothetical protein